jgi:putative copper export protein
LTTFEFANWVHLVAAATWLGGLIVLAFLVQAVRTHTDDREILRVMARRFGVVSWTAFAVAIVTGIWMYTDIGLPWRDFEMKGGLIVLAFVLALAHQLTARRTSAAVRGILQVAILVVSLGIFWAAVTLI